MKLLQTDTLVRGLLLATLLAFISGNALAATGRCAYPGKGTGMGGTGIVAKGSGMGGTGIAPEELQLAGNVIFSQGTVRAQSNGRSRLLAKGDQVCVGETIVTSQSGSAQIRMVDNEFVAIRSSTQIKIKKYVFTGTPKDGSLLAMIKGAARFVTGEIGKRFPQNDLIEASTVTVGVRGTDHEVAVILPGNSGGYPSGTYDKVNSGITYIRTQVGQIDIHPSQVGFAAKPESMPVLLKEVPDFYNVNPATINEGNVSESGGRGENGKAEQVPEQSGRGAESSSPPEHSPGGSSAEVPDNPTEVGHPEMPEPPETPEIQEPVEPGS